MTETSKENEMSEQKVEALGKIIRDAGISGVTSDRIGPFDRARADAVIAAGWVSPEEVERYKTAFVKANEAVAVREEAIVRRDKVLNDVLAALTQGITTDKAARIAAIQVLDAARAEEPS